MKQHLKWLGALALALSCSVFFGCSSSLSLGIGVQQQKSKVKVPADAQLVAFGDDNNVHFVAPTAGVMYLIDYPGGKRRVVRVWSVRKGASVDYNDSYPIHDGNDSLMLYDPRLYFEPLANCSSDQK